MGVFKDSLLIGKLPSTYKLKGRQGIARVSVSTIYNFNHTFLLVCTLTLEDTSECRGPKVNLLTKFILF